MSALSWRALGAGHAGCRDDAAQQRAVHRETRDAASGGSTLFACETGTQVEPHDVVTRYQWKFGKTGYRGGTGVAIRQYEIECIGRLETGK
ncbi:MULTISPECIES: hypothetical protein [unclassified Burkholderia]|uniref:hypothetical protein n=1 Tax=unclassified Burkholderia TaxID=2613784 RepID=UPI00211D2BBD|nr:MULTISPECIES: hypothetical protein [unclassified Burkholderia]